MGWGFGNFLNYRLKLQIGYGIIGGINQGVPDGERGMGKVPCNTGKSAAFAGLTDKIN